MRHLKFLLSALAILLAGALTAGFAARAVVAPQAGSVISAGVVSVPSVQGQAAEEVLFYPWSLYESLALRPSYPFLDDPEAEEALRQEAESYSHRFFTPFTLFGADFDRYQAFRAVQYASIRNLELVMFLKDFPGQMEDGTPLSLSFAVSIPDGAAPSSISYLVRPQEPGTVTEEQQARALERVKADLRELLTSQELLDAAAGSELRPGPAYPSETTYVPFSGGAPSYITPSGEAPDIGNDMASLLLDYCGLAQTCGITCTPVVLIWQYLQMIGEFSGFTSETTLDDALAALDQAGTQVQLVSTPDQIIVLFTNGSTMVGAYYDIQLERYSGLGLSR